MNTHDVSNVAMKNEIVESGGTTRYLRQIMDAATPMATEPPFDYKLYEKIKPFLKPGETTVQELVARTGISPTRLRDWSNEQITVFILQSELNNEADGVKEPSGFKFR